MMNDKNIDNLFRDKLKDLEKAPPAYLLGNILSGAAAARRRRRILYWRVASVAAGLLLAFVAGWQISQLSQQEAQPQVVVSHEASSKGTPDTKDSLGSTAEFSAQSTTEKEETVSVEKKETSLAASPRENLQMASSAAISKKQPSPIEAMELPEDEFAVSLPVKTVKQLENRSEKYTNDLHLKKERNRTSEREIQSIDQQIMAQNEQQLRAQMESRKKNQWLIGANVSPAVSVNRSSHSDQYASNMLNSSNTSPIDLGAGLSVEYKAGKRWSVQSGIYYTGLEQSSGNIASTSRSGYAFADIGAEYFNAPVNMDVGKMQMNSVAGVIEFKNVPGGVVVGNSIEEKSLSSAVLVTDAKFIQNFQFVEIPLYLRYTVLDARFDVELMGGLSSNVLVGNNTFMDSSSGKSNVGRTQDMQDISYSGALGLGLKYGLSKRVFLNLEPRVKYYLNSLNNNPQVEYKPYTIGVFTGISYSF